MSDKIISSQLNRISFDRAKEILGEDFKPHTPNTPTQSTESTYYTFFTEDFVIERVYFDGPRMFLMLGHHKDRS